MLRRQRIDVKTDNLEVHFIHLRSLVKLLKGRMGIYHPIGIYYIHIYQRMHTRIYVFICIHIFIVHLSINCQHLSHLLSPNKGKEFLYDFYELRENVFYQ